MAGRKNNIPVNFLLEKRLLDEVDKAAKAAGKNRSWMLRRIVHDWNSERHMEDAKQDLAALRSFFRIEIDALKEELLKAIGVLRGRIYKMRHEGEVTRLTLLEFVDEFFLLKLIDEELEGKQSKFKNYRDTVKGMAHLNLKDMGKEEKPKPAFKLTRKSFGKLKSEQVPTDVISKLEVIEGKVFSDIKPFVTELKTILDDDELQLYIDAIKGARISHKEEVSDV